MASPSPTPRSQLVARLEGALGEPVRRLSPLAGGDINQAYAVETTRRRLFAKTHSRPPAGFFQAEAEGLGRLAQAAILRLPAVVAVADTLLVLEWIEPASPTRAAAEQLGRGLAELHRRIAPQPGLERDNFIGSLPQPNAAAADWCRFFAERRLEAQLDWGARHGRLPPELVALGRRLCDGLERWLPAQVPASLLHGDLWAGNVMFTAPDTPVLIDPAVYHGHREVELAFTELFGGFGERFHAAYREAWPLEAGYAERRPLYQLYPLLVHANLFGGAYLQRVYGILKLY
jgi:fructosamine-3-kinase